MDKTRWFILHITVNIIVTCFVLPDFVYTIMNPYCVLLKPASTLFPFYLIVGLHVYHIIAFTCRAEDMFHHLFFLFSILFTTFKFFNGTYLNCSAFFGCGLPGAMNYTAIVMERLGKCTTLQR